MCSQKRKVGPKGLRKHERHSLILLVWFAQIWFDPGEKLCGTVSGESCILTWVTAGTVTAHQHNTLTLTLTPAGQIPGQHLWNGPQSGGDTCAEWWVLAFSVCALCEGGAMSLHNALRTGFSCRSLNLNSAFIKQKREVKPVADRLCWLLVTLTIYFKFFH